MNFDYISGLRPLHYAVWQNYLEAVQFLLVRGSDVNAKDDCGYTALHLSAEHGYTDIMKILLEYQVITDFWSMFFQSPIYGSLVIGKS